MASGYLLCLPTAYRKVSRVVASFVKFSEENSSSRDLETSERWMVRGSYVKDHKCARGRASSTLECAIGFGPTRSYQVFLILGLPETVDLLRIQHFSSSLIARSDRQV
ncbi:unnamed protein product [Lasius platythorax]|uniref:Uncharacterized protein n=1 Tax=Lasius platythorax TaxID=488582 RepID=A0AAV2P981_9HYME